MLFIDLPLPQQTLITLIDWSQSRNPCLLAARHAHLPIQKLQETGYLRPGKFLEYYNCDEGTTGVLPENRLFSVQRYCSMDYDCRLTFDMKPIADELAQSATAEKKPQTRRLEKIDRLTSVMKEHYSLAKEYYVSTDGQILRRPTQAELAKRIGTNQDVVSRCLNDEKAVVLRTLWNNAENVKAILGS